MAMSEKKYVVFKLDEERYGIPIESVERILADQKPVRIPRTPSLLLGVFELRGETLAAMDMRSRFEFTSKTEAGNYIVVHTRSGRIACKVDQVDGIVTLNDNEIEEGSELLHAKDDDFIAGVGKVGETLVVLVEPEAIVPKNLRRQIEKIEKPEPRLAAAA